MTATLWTIQNSRYEAELDREGECWIVHVWLVNMRGRQHLATFRDVDELAARRAARTFVANHG